MKTLMAGAVFRGKSLADIINKAIGTNFEACQRCLIEMDEFVNASGLASWFVYMNGDKHGFSSWWEWRNFLINDHEIKEVYVGSDVDKLNQIRAKTGFYPFRLAFQLDPYENEIYNPNQKCCKFLGLFMLKEFLEEGNISTIKYVKIADFFEIGSKGFDDCQLFDFDKYAKNDPRYLTPISQLDLSVNLQQMLLKANINTAGRLLELGLDCQEETARQIRGALLKHFRD